MARDKIHKALYFMAGAMTVILVLVIVVGVRIKAQSSQRSDEANLSEPVTESQLSTTEPEQQEKWQEGIISYQGKNYKYNTDLRTYLMMGVDIDGPVEAVDDYTEGGQSDAMFLLVVNTKTQSFSVVSINRNTIAEVSLCDESGYDLGTLDTQICVQHAFGDGKRLSCMRSVDAVEKLFGNIPISGYLAMNMGGIPLMNEAVGGVTLTVQEDVSFPESGVELREGETVTLNGTEAYYYLHGRDTNEFDSATGRLRREEQYIMAYMDKLTELAQGDSSAVIAVYDKIDDYLVTSVDFASLITELMDYDFSEDAMYTVPGETTVGEPIDGKCYEEYHVDEAAMQELIMQVFYEPVD